MYYHIAYGQFYPPGDDAEIKETGWHCLARWRALYYRTYAGPFETKAEAEAAVAKMSTAMDNLFELFDRE